MFNADLLAKLRQESRHTLKEVADFVGVTAPYISSMEKGRVKSPAYSVVESVAKLFRVNPQDLMDGGKEPEPKETEPKETEPVVDIMAMRDIRFARKLSVNKAAQKAGINPSTLSLIENGKRRAVGMMILTKLAEAYDVDVNELLLQREEYVDLTALVMQSDTVIINGEDVDVSHETAMERILTALEMGAAWAREGK